MTAGIFNPTDKTRSTVARPARTALADAVRKWYAAGIYPNAQDFNDLIAQFRAAGDAFAITDTEGDDDYLLKIMRAAGREKLTGARTYYVRTDGSDSNDGLSDTAGGAFLTIQKAVNTVLALNFNGQAVTIQVRDGTFAEAVTISGPIIGLGSLAVTGNTTTPANCIISPATGAAFALSNGAVASIGGFKFASTNSYGVYAGTGSTLTISGACEFGACSIAHIGANSRSRVIRSASCTITGAAARHLYGIIYGSIEGVAGTVVTITGTPAFSTAFVEMNRGSNYYEGNGASAYSGAATGFKFLVDVDCSLRSTTSVANMNDILPGNKIGVFRPLQGTPNRPFRNLLYNASGRLRDGPAGAIGDDAYGLHNRWYVLSQSGNVTPSAIDDAADGIPSLMRLTNSHGAAQRMAYAQILPGHVSRPLRGKRLWASITARSSHALTTRISVLSWSGTEDVVTSDIVNTWTSATYTVGNFFTNPAGLSVLMSIGQALSAVDTLQNLAASTWFADVPSDCNNLIVMVHQSAAMNAAATADYRVQLEEGAQNTEFDLRPLEIEKRLCSPYYQKKTVRSENGDRHIPLMPMRAAPTVTVSAGTANNITADGFELNHSAAASIDITASAEL